MNEPQITCLNSRSFGAPKHPKTRHLVSGVVAGVGGYGNSFGVPTVGGQVRFHTRYDGNILVNAMAVGLAETTKIFYAAASGVNMPIVYLGSKTGRDGIHGASMASAEFDDDSAEKRPTVQVGDPFAEKLLLEACLEIMEADCVIAIQDMGAAGLTCSAVEMGAKGDLGVDLDLDAVPTRETGMSAYEMMLSESQERMLMVLRPEKEKEAEAIFRKWGLDFAVVGYTTPSKRFVVRQGGDVRADLPIKELGDEAPLYDRPHVASPPLPVVHARDIEPPEGNGPALEKLIATPELCSKRWVWEQYDHVILGNTVQRPGGDAAVVRVQDGPKGLALTVDVTPRYCEADPFLVTGEPHGWLGQSVYLRDICGREEGAPPPVDLAAEKRNGCVVRGMIHAGTATAAHDISDGGLLVAIAEMAIASGIGAQLLAGAASVVRAGRPGAGEDERRRRAVCADRDDWGRHHQYRRGGAGLGGVIEGRLRELVPGLYGRQRRLII